jgi:hypothetical protein
MKLRRVLQSACVSFMLGTVAPLVLAQADNGDSTDGRHSYDPQLQACRKQADDRGLAHGTDRRSFVHSCMKSAHEHVAPPSGPPSA